MSKIKLNVLGSGVSLGSVMVSLTDTTALFTLITLVIGIISGVLSIGYTIYKWYKSAIEDGKVTKEEIEDLIGQVKPEIDKVMEEIENVDRN